MTKRTHKISISKRFIASALMGSLAFSLCACGNHPSPQSVNRNNLTNNISAAEVSGKAADEAFITSSADFSIELFRQSVQTNTQEDNVLISPQSVLSALAMTANGAGDSTRTEMESVLCNGMTIEEFNPYMYTYNQQLADSDDVTFHMANSIWMKDDADALQVKEDFLITDKTYYNADAYLAPFDESTVNDINNWVDTNTNGMIDSLLMEIPDQTVMYLINALAFEGEWETPYKETQIIEQGTFTNSNGVEETVPMLNSCENLYIEGEHATGFIKYYKGGEFAFLALLPEEGMSVEEYVDTLTGESYLELYENREYQEVIVRIPEFSYEYSTELKEPLTNMGMEEAFQPNANFTNMATTDTELLYINRVLHKTYIELDRSGTKAAAVTAVEMNGETASAEEEAPPSVILDRPFVYAIIDTETGLPVFMGTVNTVE
ncbi:MAG: serpin family protein [Lachnospiraceae bacterium]|nr:serpin family protein [Lachnospiraceae bacterium]